MTTQESSLKGPVELQLIGGPLDGYQRSFEDLAPPIYEEHGARYRLDLYMHDYRFMDLDATPAAVAAGPGSTPAGATGGIVAPETVQVSAADGGKSGEKA